MRGVLKLVPNLIAAARDANVLCGPSLSAWFRQPFSVSTSLFRDPDIFPGHIPLGYIRPGHFLSQTIPLPFTLGHFSFHSHHPPIYNKK